MARGKWKYVNTSSLTPVRKIGDVQVYLDPADGRFGAETSDGWVWNKRLDELVARLDPKREPIQAMRLTRYGGGIKEITVADLRRDKLIDDKGTAYGEYELYVYDRGIFAKIKLLQDTYNDLRNQMAEVENGIKTAMEGPGA